MREARPSNDAASAHSSQNLSNNNTIWQWKSPIPYVFVSLSVAFAVILLAIVVLVCSLHKQQQQQQSDDGDDKSDRSTPDKAAETTAPSFIVVMAGDAKPTHIAVPIPSSLSPHEQVYN